MMIKENKDTHRAKQAEELQQRKKEKENGK